MSQLLAQRIDKLESHAENVMFFLQQHIELMNKVHVVNCLERINPEQFYRHPSTLGAGFPYKVDVRLANEGHSLGAHDTLYVIGSLRKKKSGTEEFSHGFKLCGYLNHGTATERKTDTVSFSIGMDRYSDSKAGGFVTNEKHFRVKMEISTQFGQVTMADPDDGRPGTQYPSVANEGALAERIASNIMTKACPVAIPPFNHAAAPQSDFLRDYVNARLRFAMDKPLQWEKAPLVLRLGGSAPKDPAI